MGHGEEIADVGCEIGDCRSQILGTLGTLDILGISLILVTVDRGFDPTMR